MIDLTVDPDGLARNVRYCREKGIILPTLAMLQDPRTIPTSVRQRLADVGPGDLHPANLFRITWKNQPAETGGGFGGVNHVVFPPALTGCAADILVLTGHGFPTGAHKVGAAYGCLVPRLVTGRFDPRHTRAVWPSTGNYCRGGAWISALLACRSIAILPEGMSRERFDWLRRVAGEVIITPGSEANVKEIFDRCRELRDSGQDLRIFNQFDEMGNPLWHYTVTGRAVEELLDARLAEGRRFAGFVAASGSGGTLGAGYYLKRRFPRSRLAVAEALQCPTLLQNGYGDHRIEGIGDKHVPWVHDCRETDFVIAVDDALPMRLLRLFNEPVGRRTLAAGGVDPQLVEKLDRLGISGIGNLVAAIKFAKYNELTGDDLVVTVATDGMRLYGSRLKELAASRGPYDEAQAQRDLECLAAVTIDHMQELGHYDRKRLHNLKYFTWIEQQGKDPAELDAQWADHDRYWSASLDRQAAIDELIADFNQRVGLI